MSGDKDNRRMKGTPGNAFMAFVVSDTVQQNNPIISLPPTLSNYTIDTSNIFRSREKVLMKANGLMLIDGKAMDMMRLDDTLLVNTMEKWTIKNETDFMSHPFHIHKTQFQIIEYTGNIGVDSSTTPQTYTYPNLPHYMMGYKDDILIRGGASVTFVARFDSFPDYDIDPRNGFMYHCHILTHEDHAMMAQFTVVDSATYYEAVGIEPVTIGSYTLYPNPAKNTLFLRGESQEAGTIRIYDLLGRELLQQQVMPFAGDIAVNTSSLPRGMVLVEWRTQNHKEVQRILLE
jgi:hypothetical protein